MPTVPTVKSIGVKEKVIKMGEQLNYKKEMERILNSLHHKFMDCKSPMQVAFATMKAIIEFYDAECCGILDVDLELDIWTSYWWYHRDYGEMAGKKSRDIEWVDNFERWKYAIRTHEIVIVSDIENIKKSYPREYETYNRLAVKSVIGVPFWMNSSGIVAIKNPQRFVDQTGFLRLLSYSIIAAFNEYRTCEADKHTVLSPGITNESDVYISMFGELIITTSKGVLTENDLKSPKIVRLLAYLLLSKKNAVSPREIQDNIWPDEEVDIPGKNIKGLVYRFQQLFSLISDMRLIESTSNGYCLNPKLNIITDLKVFDNKWNIAINSSSDEDKTELLENLVELYKGDLLCSASQEHWLLATSTNYQYRYIGAINELMKVLWENKQYHHIHTYAAKALGVVHNNSDIYYWMIRSMSKQDNIEMAKSLLRMSNSILLEEEYITLTSRLMKHDECKPLFI